jgi:hypothetical protein
MAFGAAAGAAAFTAVALSQVPGPTSVLSAVGLGLFGSLWLVAAMQGFFEGALTETIDGHDEPGAMPDLTDLPGEVLMPAVPLTFFLWLCGGASVAYIASNAGELGDKLIPTAALALLLAAPFAYWPMGLAWVAFKQSSNAIFMFGSVVRCIRGVLNDYLVVVGIGAAALLVAGGVGLFLLVKAAGAGAALLMGSVAGAALVYAHGVMGALMGRLIKERPDLFEAAPGA